MLSPDFMDRFRDTAAGSLDILGKAINHQQSSINPSGHPDAPRLTCLLLSFLCGTCQFGKTIDHTQRLPVPVASL